MNLRDLTLCDMKVGEVGRMIGHSSAIIGTSTMPSLSRILGSGKQYDLGFGHMKAERIS